MYFNSNYFEYKIISLFLIINYTLILYFKNVMVLQCINYELHIGECVVFNL